MKTRTTILPLIVKVLAVFLTLSFSSCCKNVPKMKINNIEGPTKEDCGGFKWVVQLELEKNSPKGGWFVQELTIKRSIDKKCPSDCDAEDITYYEAWKVNAGKKVTTYAQGGDKEDDTYQLPNCPGTEGSSSYKGKVRFFENLTLPADFKANNPKTYAGILPSTTKKPKFWKAKCALDHNLDSKWNCCEDPKKHDLTTVPDMSKKEKEKKKPGGGKIFQLLGEAKAWTHGDGYSDNDNVYMLNVARVLIQSSQSEDPIEQLDIKESLATYTDHYRGDLDELSKVYILLRFLYDVPNSTPIENAKVFGGWMKPSEMIQGETFDMLWPVANVQSKTGPMVPKVVDTFKGYTGVGYDAMGEYDYFNENFSLRPF